MAQKTAKASQERVKRESKAQNDRSPMLAVRVPRSLYRAMKAAAKHDKRTLADWVRLHAPLMLSLSLPPADYVSTLDVAKLVAVTPEQDITEAING